MLCYCSIFDVVASAQTQPENALQSTNIQEILKNAADISGAIVIGVQVQQIANDGPNLIGYIPSQWAGQEICVQISSSDGRYEAMSDYQVPADWTGGHAKLDFPTAHPDLLRSVNIDEIGAMLRRSKCEDLPANDVSFILWNSTEQMSLDVLLNSFGADDVFAYVSNDAVPIRCSEIESNLRTAFDRKCSISTQGLEGLTAVEVYRLNDGKPSSPTTVEIWLPE